jgi:peptide/nickel transport system permease protein
MSSAPRAPGPSAVADETSSRWQGPRQIFVELLHDRFALCGASFLVLLVLVAVLASYLAPYDPSLQSLDARLIPPIGWSHGTWHHPLGTDGLGRDILSRLMFGARTSLIAGAVVVVIAGVIGTLAGLLAGYYGGILDAVVTRLGDAQIAFPGLLLALVVLAVTGPGLTIVIVVLIVNGWILYARIARGHILATRESLHVEAAAIIGAKTSRILRRHVFPTLAAPMAVLSALEFARVILAESSLSFLGLGVQPPGISWGLELADGFTYIFTAWWVVTLPGIVITLTVLAINIVASWLGEVLDVATREQMRMTR